MNPKICPICHAPIPENAPGGLCPACVLRDADEPAVEAADTPSLADLAAAFPKLEILRLIGHGGMGFVYQARQPELDRMVALKILSPVLRRDPAFEERFAREARVLGKLQHPNIVTLHEHGESGGFFYLLMEYIDGVNLRQAMAAGRFTPEQALAIVPAICDALQSAHVQGVWHRDIKPENILLDRDGRVKIADFGIARILGDPERNFTLTRTGGMLGSAAYMAPEQHEKPHDVDHRADIYSLGVVIYEMLTGELPLGRFPAPSQRAAVNSRIDEIVLRTLEKERELRQQSASEVKTEVEGVGNQPISPNPASNPRFDSLPPFVMWSLGLMVGGVVLAPLGFYIMEKFRHSGGGAIGAFALAVGGLALALGLTGSLWRLFAMKRGWVPTTGRRLLITLAIPTLAATGFGLVVFSISTMESAGMSWPHLVSLLPAKGSVLLQQAFFFGALSLALASVFYLTRPLSPATAQRRELGIVCIVLAACAAIVGTLVRQYDTKQQPPLGYQKVEFNDGIQFAFSHPRAKTGGCSIQIPLRVSENWIPESGQGVLLNDGSQLLVKARVTAANRGTTTAEVASSMDQINWDTQIVSLDTGSRKKTANLQNGTKVDVQLLLVGDEIVRAKPEDAPRVAMEEILRAARNGNGRVFEKGLSRSMKAEMNKEGTDPSKAFGDFARVVFVEAKMVDDKTAEVVVEATDGTKRRITLQMILEDGEWKLTDHGL